MGDAGDIGGAVGALGRHRQPWSEQARPLQHDPVGHQDQTAVIACSMGTKGHAAWSKQGCAGISISAVALSDMQGTKDRSACSRVNAMEVHMHRV